tara:strand:- start:519 stop:1220 length:702 start_codon:yes stop_codon:yes gene_type:complete
MFRTLSFSLSVVIFCALNPFVVKANEEKKVGDWEVIAQEDGFITKRKEVSESSIFAFRGEMVADLHISKIVSAFLDSSRRKEWVDRFGEQVNIEGEGLNKIYWIRFAMPLLISDRDYVLKTNGEIDKDRQVLTTHIHSVEHPAKEKDDCCIRAQAFGTYYRFEAIKGEEKTRLEVEVHTDPKGWLPAFLVNMIQKNWPKKTLSNLVKASMRDDVIPDQRFLEWGKVIGKDPKK